MPLPSRECWQFILFIANFLELILCVVLEKNLLKVGCTHRLGVWIMNCSLRAWRTILHCFWSSEYLFRFHSKINCNKSVPACLVNRSGLIDLISLVSQSYFAITDHVIFSRELFCYPYIEIPHSYARGYLKIWKQQFLRVSSHGLKWGN